MPLRAGDDQSYAPNPSRAQSFSGINRIWTLRTEHVRKTFRNQRTKLNRYRSKSNPGDSCSQRHSSDVSSRTFD